MKKESKAGRAVLLKRKHFEINNPWGNSVVGWMPSSQGQGGLYNPRGYGLVRVVVQKRFGKIMQCLYDQPMIIENAGAIIIAQLGKRIALTQNFRMVGERLLPEAGTKYIQRLQDERLWEKLTQSLGRWCWEAPRGLINIETRKNQTSASDFVLQSAKFEALEEAGIKVASARIVGRVNTNSTFFAHAQEVVHAKIVSLGKAIPEDYEILGKTRLFTMRELRRLNSWGAFDDGATLAALALCGLKMT